MNLPEALCTLYNGWPARFQGVAPALHVPSGSTTTEGQMEERTTVEKRTTVVPAEPDSAGTTNINIDGATGATTIEKSEPAPRQTTVRETTVERTTRS